MPDLGDELRKACRVSSASITTREAGVLTDVIRVELVYAHKHAGRGSAQTPRHDGSQRRELARVEVVHAARVELGEVRSAYTNFP